MLRRVLGKEPKNPMLENMTEIARGIQLISEARRESAKGIQSFYHLLGCFVEITMPETIEPFRVLREIYRQIVKSQKQLALVENDVADSLTELAGRFSKVVECTNEYNNQRELYKKKSNDLIEAMAEESFQMKKDTYPKVMVQCETDVATAKAHKRLGRDRLKDSIRDLIQAREIYTQVKKRVLREAWEKYAEALKTAATTEKLLYIKFNEAVTAFMSTGRIPPELCEKIIETNERIIHRNRVAATNVETLQELAASNEKTEE